jgi:hypothetical protein
VLLFDAVRLTSGEYFVSLAVFVVFNLPSLGHKFLALARDYDDFRANRSQPEVTLSRQDEDWQWEGQPGVPFPAEDLRDKRVDPAPATLAAARQLGGRARRDRVSAPRVTGAKTASRGPRTPYPRSHAAQWRTETDA